MKIIQVQNRGLPYVAFKFTFGSGAAQDPPGKEGLAYLTAHMLSRGTAAHTRNQLADELDFVGSSAGIIVRNESIQVAADCSTRNLQRLLSLLAEMIARPAFPETELEKLKRQTIAEISELKDSDGAAAGLFFAQLLFEGHPYAHPIRGYRDTVSAITRDDVVAFYQKHFCTAALVVGVAGDLDKRTAQDASSSVASLLPEGVESPPTPPAPGRGGGVRGLLVTKPDKSQAQVVLGQPAITGCDPRLFPLRTTVTGFGGTFTSLLVREIREKRGWSYGVGASLFPGKRAGVFSIRYAPKNADVGDAVRLTLELLEELRGSGLDRDNLEFAKQFMINQFPFAVDTPLKKMDMRLNVLLTGKPADYLDTYVERVRAVDMETAAAAVASLLDPDKMVLAVVGDESLEAALRPLSLSGGFRKLPVSWDGPLPR